MRFLAVIILLTIAGLSNGQMVFDRTRISNATEKIVREIEQSNQLSDDILYEDKLKKISTTTELTELTNHPNVAVRCYAFWALSLDHSADLFSLVINHINDNQLVKHKTGCVSYLEKVGDFFINVVTPGYVDLQSKKFNAAQFAKLDSILIYSTNDLNASSHAINRSLPLESLYCRIRELVIDYHNQSAIVKLAEFQKEQDVELILKNRKDHASFEDGYYHTYKAISKFPHPRFVSLLESHLQNTLDNTHYDTDWALLYKAIASYKNTKAVELLKIPFTNVEHEQIRKYHIDFVFEAVSEFTDPIYDSLLWNLWANENRISTSVLKYLLINNSEMAFDLSKKSLLPVNDWPGIFNNLNEENSSENIIAAMLDIVLQKDRTFALEVIKTNLLNSDVHSFPIFATLAEKLKDKLFIEPLLKRLETEDNPHTYLKAAEVLIAYDNKEINVRIREAKKKNQALNADWGGREFNELLKKYRLN
jgi:hypothetical protein